MFVFRLRHVHAVHRCGLLLQMSHVAWSVCLCVLGSRVSRAKTAEPINRDVVWGTDSCGSKKPCITWGSRYLTGSIAGGGASRFSIPMQGKCACPLHAADEMH